MKLWSKTLIASAVCLFLAGCDDSSKVDANLDKAKDNAQQIKEAASDKAEAIKDQADKHIDAIKKTGGGRGQQPQQPGLQHQGGSG